MRVAVLGSGGWGTALALRLLDNGHDVALWSYQEAESAELREKRENPVLPGVALPDSLAYTSDICCVKGREVVILVTPSFAVRTTAQAMKGLLDPGAVVVTASKGIEKDTSLTFTQVLEEELGEGHPIVALSGPSHAEEVSRRVPTGLVSACREKAPAELVQDLFMSPVLRVYTSDDPVGVELSAALKNVIALCAGACDGLGYGVNTKAMLMTRGLTEIGRLVVAMGGRKETVAGLAGVGDLIVTCTSLLSRNCRCGLLIGQGKAPAEAVKEIGMVVEGYYAAATAKTLADKLGVEMPIAQAAYAVLYEGKDAKATIGALMSREKKHESEESWL